MIRIGTAITNMFGPKTASDVRSEMTRFADKSLAGPAIFEGIDSFDKTDDRMTAVFGLLLCGIYFALIDKDPEDWRRFGRFFGLSSDHMNKLIKLVQLDGEPSLSQREVNQLFSDAEENDDQLVEGGMKRIAIPPDAISEKPISPEKYRAFHAAWDDAVGGRFPRIARIGSYVGSIIRTIADGIGLTSAIREEELENDADSALQNAAEFVSRIILPFPVDFFNQELHERTGVQRPSEQYVMDRGIRRALDFQYNLDIKKKGLEDFVALDLFKIGRLFSLHQAAIDDPQNQVNILKSIKRYISDDQLTHPDDPDKDLITEYGEGALIQPLLSMFLRPKLGGF